MATDNAKAAQLLRGHDKRISRLEEREEPEGPANLLRVQADDTRLWDDVSTTVTQTTNTAWGSADWSGSNDATSNLNWG